MRTGSVSYTHLPVNYLTYDIEVYDVNEWNEPGLIVVVVNDLNAVAIPKLSGADIALIRNIRVSDSIDYDSGRVVKLDVLTKGTKKTYEIFYGEEAIYFCRCV